jgi:hypothetical protein
MFQGSFAEEHCQASHFYWNQKSQFHFRDKHKYSWGTECQKHDPPKMKKNDQSGEKSDLPEASAGSRRGRI